MSDSGKKRRVEAVGIEKYTMIELLPTLAALTVLEKMVYSDIAALCSAGSLFAYRFCGAELGKSRDLQDIIYARGFQQTAAMYVMLFERDWGISRNPMLCSTSIPAMRERVAASMREHFPPERDSMLGQIINMRKAYLKMYTITNHLTWAGVIYTMGRTSLALFPQLDRVIPNTPSNKDKKQARVLSINPPGATAQHSEWLLVTDQRFGLVFKSRDTINRDIYYLQGSEFNRINSYRRQLNGNTLATAVRFDMMPERTDAYRDGTSYIYRSALFGTLTIGPYRTSSEPYTFVLQTDREAEYDFTLPELFYDLVALPVYEMDGQDGKVVLFYDTEMPVFAGNVDQLLEKLQPPFSGNMEEVVGGLQDNKKILVVDLMDTEDGPPDNQLKFHRIDEPGKPFQIVISNFAKADQDQATDTDHLLLYHVVYNSATSSLIFQGVYEFPVSNDTETYKIKAFSGAVVLSFRGYSTLKIRVDFDNQIVEEYFSAGEHGYNKFGYTIGAEKETKPLENFRVQ